MIYAVKHSKVNKAIYKANEDALTSSIFERLMYLPRELMQQIFSKALFDTVPELDFNQLESITYWPSWNADDIEDKTRVEPDIFIHTLRYDIIIEAKRYDAKQQSKRQWENEIKAYYNEYSDDEKPLLFIALGGLHNNETESIPIKGKEDQLIYKCTWKSILNAIQHIIHDMELATDYTNSNIAITNILKDIVLCFELFGYSSALWLERFIQAPQIKQKSLNYFYTPWIN